MWQKIKCWLGLKRKVYLLVYTATDIHTGRECTYNTSIYSYKIDEDDILYIKEVLKMQNDIRDVILLNIIRLDGVRKDD